MCIKHIPDLRPPYVVLENIEEFSDDDLEVDSDSSDDSFHATADDHTSSLPAPPGSIRVRLLEELLEEPPPPLIHMSMFTEEELRIILSNIAENQRNEHFPNMLPTSEPR